MQNVQLKKETVLFCKLIMDEIAICKHIEYNVTEFRGYLDHETGNDDSDCLPVGASTNVNNLKPYFPHPCNERN